MKDDQSTPLHKCEYCGEPYVLAEDAHACSQDKIRERLATLKTLSGTLVKYFVSEFAWTFTLADGVAVKVEFHAKTDIQPHHIQAFARIFSVVAENYVSDQSDSK